MAHTNYRSSDGLNDVPVSLQTPLPVTASAGTDSSGSALPANFDSLAQTITPGTYGPTAIAVTDGTNTWTQTLTYDGSGNLTGVSAWVRT